MPKAEDNKTTNEIKERTGLLKQAFKKKYKAELEVASPDKRKMLLNNWRKEGYEREGEEIKNNARLLEDIDKELCEKIIVSSIGRAKTILKDIAVEIDLWFHLWKGKQETDDKLKKDIEIIDLLNGTDVFNPTIRQALLILITIPCITATVERTFSTLRRVKTWLRSTMGECMNLLMNSTATTFQSTTVVQLYTLSHALIAVQLNMDLSLQQKLKRYSKLYPSFITKEETKWQQKRLETHGADNWKSGNFESNKLEKPPKPVSTDEGYSGSDGVIEARPGDVLTAFSTPIQDRLYIEHLGNVFITYKKCRKAAIAIFKYFRPEFCTCVQCYSFWLISSPGSVRTGYY
nr:unnamed protein product [Callosobruchus analis]